MKKITLIVCFMFGFNSVVAHAQASRYQAAWPDTDFAQSLIDLGEIMSGGPPRDGIPAVDQPEFDTVAQAAEWLGEQEPVIALVVDGKARAYPLQILMYHEIVNDELNGLPVSVTFCPLCNASIAFERYYKGQLLDFGTTGLLRRSDLVMYDRQTDSWWQQFSGKAIVGEYAGAVLHRVPSSIVAFDTFAGSYPEGEVLNRDTGHSRPYGRNPYSGYDDINSSPFLYAGKTDGRLAPMERVLSISDGAMHRIYPFERLETEILINDQLGEIDVVVMAQGKVLSALDDSTIAASREIPEATAWRRQVPGRDGSLTFSLVGDKVVDDQTGSVWSPLGQAVDGPLKGIQLEALADSGVHFAFAWLAFNPDTEIYGQ